MAIRTGMQNLVNRVRALTNAGTAEYTAGSVVYWTDNHIQDILDSNAQYLIDLPLTWRPQSIGGGTTTYIIAEVPYRDFEELSSGTTRWIVRSGPGAEIGTTTYTPDYRAGRIAFTSDQGGSAYYLTAYTYDVFGAAADLWLERMANFNDWYQFSADNQTFSRQQAWEHAVKSESLMRGKVGANFTAGVSGDIRTSVFYRTDIQ